MTAPRGGKSQPNFGVLRCIHETRTEGMNAYEFGDNQCAIAKYRLGVATDATGLPCTPSLTLATLL